MPRLFFRDPVTRAMIPLTLGGSSGGNEVTIAPTAPTDGSELWFDQTANQLKYLHPINGTYTAVPGGSGGGGGGMTDALITSGTGMSGGGWISTGITLNVNAGSGITVDADYVSVNKGTLDSWYKPADGHAAIQISNWNDAVLNNTNYMGADAANAPDSGWWYGFTISHNTIWKHQYLTPFANPNWNSGTIFEREMDNGAWGDWNRTGTYMHSKGTLDIGTFAQLNGNRADMGIRRCFWGIVKDKGTAGASNSDAWQVNFYNTAGTYAGQAIKIPLGTGVVAHPQGHTSLMTSLRTRAPIQTDAVATVGVVMEIVAAALAQAGITLNKTAIARLIEESTE